MSFYRADKRANSRIILPIFLSFFLLFNGHLISQTLPKKFTQKPEIPEDQRTSFDAGEFHLENKDYSQALNYFQSLYEQNNGNIVYKYRLAVCYLYNSEEMELALQYLKEILKEDKSLQHLYYYLGIAFARNYKFDEAIVAFNRYLLEGQEKETGNEIKRLIEECESAKLALNEPIPITITNIGSPINTDFNEYVPVISSDESVLMFTYQGPKSKGGLMDEKFNEDQIFGEYYEDIFVSYKVGNSWMEPIPLPDNINSLGHDACIALSGDGQKLFIFKSNLQDNGDIYMSTLEGEVWGDPIKMGAEINSLQWDGSISLSSDENTVYFSSERPGGYGGKDIWMSVRQADGTWGKATNLGPVINTKFDDDAPFIHADGKTFYFSSQGHNSIGGFDIFKSNFNDNLTWSEPQNMGHPINTPGDDIYFVVSANGDRGYYSSGKVGGLGKRDIYMMDLNPLGPKPIVALVRGTITDNGKPVKATIYYENEGNGKKVGPFYANSSTGKYIIPLNPGTSYKIIYEVSGYATKSETVNLRNLNKFVEVYKNVYFPDNIVNNTDSTSLALQTIIENKVKEIETIQNTDQNKVITADKQTDNLADNQQIIKQTEEINKVQNQTDNLADNQRNAQQTSETNKISETVVSPIQENEKVITPETIAVKEKETTISTDNTISSTQNQECNCNKFVNKDLNNISIYKPFINECGSVQIDGLIFKLQIGAYRRPGNFKYDNVKDLASADIVPYGDGITRFTMKEFTNLREAEAFRQMVVQAGIKDAWIVAFYKGKRMVLEDLIRQNFFRSGSM